MRGFSFSLKRFLGITQVKQQIARQTGIPTAKSGMNGDESLALNLLLHLGKKHKVNGKMQVIWEKDDTEKVIFSQ